MSISFEQADALRQHTGVSYGEAKAALEAASGDMLEAIILLEKQGKVGAPPGGTFVTGGGQIHPDTGVGKAPSRLGAEESRPKQEFYLESPQKDRDSTLGRQLKSLWRAFCRLVHKGNINNFEIYRNGRKVVSLPINVLVLALCFFFWLTLPALVVGLFFSFRYRFYGPDIGRDTLNRVMDKAAETAEQMKQSVQED